MRPQQRWRLVAKSLLPKRLVNLLGERCELGSAPPHKGQPGEEPQRPERRCWSTAKLPEPRLYSGDLDEECKGLKCPVMPRNSTNKGFTGIDSNSSLHVCRWWWVIYKTLSDPALCGGGGEERNELTLQMGKLRTGRSVVSSKCHSSQQGKRQV